MLRTLPKVMAKTELSKDFSFKLSRGKTVAGEANRYLLSTVEG